MKKYLIPKILPLAMLCTGALGALLRAWLYTSGVDKKGLLITAHPANILTWILTAAVFILVSITCRPLKEANKFRFNFPASITSAAGCAAAALGVLVDAFGHFGGDALQNTTGFLGVFSTAALLFIGFCRLKGRYPSVLFNGLICLYLMMTLVGLYRTWSASPQLQSYVFSLMGCVFVMLGCYHDAAFAAHAGSRQKHTFYHMMSVFFCLVSLPHNENHLFYLALAAWMLTGHCNLTPMVSKPQASEDPALPAEITPEELPAAEESVTEDPQTDLPVQKNSLPVFDFASLQQEISMQTAQEATPSEFTLEE